MAKKYRRLNRYFHNSRIPVETVAAYADRLLGEIKDHLHDALSFTREDLLHLPVVEFQQVATITRYKATSIAVRYLIEQGSVIKQKSPYLCLPERVNEFSFHNHAALSSEYAAKIRSLVRSMPKNKPFAVHHVVMRWRTDPQLTTDLKRRAVRGAIGRLTHENICTKVNNFQYVVGASHG